MTLTEQAVVFDCEGESLVGVLTLPAGEPSRTAVIVVVGGPQYRAGSHRQFVLLARRLAEAGHPVLRFDVRGMGDSSGEARSFEALRDDVGAAVALLRQRVPGAERVVLWGLCDGASAALLYCHETHDPRIVGLCLLNPWVRSEASLARTHVRHYYAQRLMDRAFWSKLLRGGVGAGAFGGLLKSIRAARGHADLPALSYQQRMAAAWHDSDRVLLLILSGNDYTAKEFADFAATDASWAGGFDHPRLRRHDLARADHTFTGVDDRAEVERTTLEWLQASWPEPAAVA